LTTSSGVHIPLSATASNGRAVDPGSEAPRPSYPGRKPPPTGQCGRRGHLHDRSSAPSRAATSQGCGKSPSCGGRKPSPSPLVEVEAVRTRPRSHPPPWPVPSTRRRTMRSLAGEVSRRFSGARRPALRLDRELVRGPGVPSTHSAPWEASPSLFSPPWEEALGRYRPYRARTWWYGRAGAFPCPSTLPCWSASSPITQRGPCRVGVAGGRSANRVLASGQGSASSTPDNLTFGGNVYVQQSGRGGNRPSPGVESVAGGRACQAPGRRRSWGSWPLGVLRVGPAGGGPAGQRLPANPEKRSTLQFDLRGRTMNERWRLLRGEFRRLTPAAIANMPGLGGAGIYRVGYPPQLLPPRCFARLSSLDYPGASRA